MKSKIKQIKVHVVLVKPIKMMQQCLSIYKICKSNEGAMKVVRGFLLTYPEGYYEIQTFHLNK